MKRIFNNIVKQSGKKCCVPCNKSILIFLAIFICILGAGTGTADDVNITLKGHFGGSTYATAVSGNYEYMGQGQDLVVLDISNTSQPLELGSIRTGDGVLDITISGNYAYVADYDNGLVIIDISNPAAPTLTGSVDTAGDAYGVAVSGSYAYVADTDNGLVIIDIGNPAAPTLAGSVNSIGIAESVAVSGSYTYVAGGSNGLFIIDISNQVVPTLVGSYNTAGNAYSTAVSGNYAYVADSSNGLVIIDISNPTVPILVGSINTAGKAYGVVISGSYVYVADRDNGLVIIDISNPTAPIIAASVNTTGSAYGVAVLGSYAFVADDDNGLVIIDISNPVAPTLAGSYNTAGSARWVAVSGSYAYVADDDNGLVIIDISNPITPTLAGSYNTAGFAYSVAVSGSYAYVADTENGLVIVHTNASGAGTTLPTLAITSPANGAIFINSSITISGIASDDTAIVNVMVNGILATGTTDWSATITITNSTNTITAIATDNAGNTVTDAITVTYIPDLRDKFERIYEEWEASAHNSKEVGMYGDSNEFYGTFNETTGVANSQRNYCNECHSPLDWDTSKDPDTEVALTADFKGVSCAACHDIPGLDNWINTYGVSYASYNATKNTGERSGEPYYYAGYDVVESTNELCVKCHDDISFIGSWKQTGLLKFECIDCHMVTSITNSTANGHSFKANLTLLQENPDCSVCHITGSELGNISTSIENIQIRFDERIMITIPILENALDAVYSYEGERSLSMDKLEQLVLILEEVSLDEGWGCLLYT